MEYIIIIATSAEGVVGEVGIREITPQDRIMGIAPLTALRPAPETMQALEGLIAQAKREDRG